MKVKFIKATVEKFRTYGQGGIYDIPRADALYYIKIGRAEKVEEKKPKQRPVKINKVRAETRPVK